MKKIVLMLALVLLAAPAFADRIIYNGSDLWTTPGNGGTFADFSLNPIPAGFFCANSAPFTGRIAFKGVPLATAIPRVLGTTDTIVQRLDDAAFNKKGVASTRLQVRALNLESIAPVKTACGNFKAVVSLDGVQPITRMRIVQDSEKGGRFMAPLELNVKIRFLGLSREKLEIRQTVRFDGAPRPWSSAPDSQREKTGMFLVDTDGDRVADTWVPGTSNFILRGERSKVFQQQEIERQPSIDPRTGYDHRAPTHAHLVVTTDQIDTTINSNN